MSEMVEKVARALCAKHGDNPDRMAQTIEVFATPTGGAVASFTGPPEPVWKSCIPAARAAIEAMREPDTAMIDAASRVDTEPEA